MAVLNRETFRSSFELMRILVCSLGNICIGKIYEKLTLQNCCVILLKIMFGAFGVSELQLLIPMYIFDLIRHVVTFLW